MSPSPSAARVDEPALALLGRGRWSRSCRRRDSANCCSFCSSCRSYLSESWTMSRASFSSTESRGSFRKAREPLVPEAAVPVVAPAVPVMAARVEAREDVPSCSAWRWALVWVSPLPAVVAAPATLGFAPPRPIAAAATRPAAARPMPARPVEAAGSARRPCDEDLSDVHVRSFAREGLNVEPLTAGRVPAAARAIRGVSRRAGPRKGRSVRASDRLTPAPGAT